MATSLSSLQTQVNALIANDKALQSQIDALKAQDTAFAGQVTHLQAEIDAITGPAPVPPPAPSPPPPPPPPVSPPPPPPVITGFPDATNTGATGTLTAHAGDLTINTDGAIVEHLDVTGVITVAAANVTVRNCKVTSPAGAGYAIYSDRLGTLIENCTVIAPGGAGGATTTGVWVETGSKNATVRGCNISGCTNGVFLNDTNQVVEGCYIHDLVPENIFGNPDTTPNAPHTDGVQMWDNQCDGSIIRNNRIESVPFWATSAIIGNRVKNLTVDHNYLSGAGYTMYIYLDDTNTYTNNVFGPHGQYGSVTVIGGSGHPTWTNNTDAATGAPINY